MPYIVPEIRNELGIHIIPLNEGELNYCITQLVRNYVGANPEDPKEPSYRKINGAIGALECAKMELYRRIAAPYENQKIIDNGDVYREYTY
jgi:hypothetical protein